MDAHLDTLSDELCQVSTCVGHIAWWQACLGGFIESPSPSPEASEDDDFDDDDDDEDEDASFFGDDKMTAWVTCLFQSWQKGGVVLGMRVVMFLGEGLVIGDIFVMGSVFLFMRDVMRTYCIFSFLYFSDILFLHCDSKPCTYVDIYIYRLLLLSFTYLFMCCFFSLFMYMLLIYCMQSFIFISH